MSPDGKHKRSWRNLLLNKRYQLSFTLFMVGLSTVLMVGLGIWVMRVANETTKVSRTSVMGTPCPAVPSLTGGSPDDGEEMTSVPMKLPEDGIAGPDEAPADDDRPRRKIVVSLDPMELAKPAVAPPAILPSDYATAVVKHWTCELKIGAQIEALERGRLRILWTLIGTGLLLVLGLAAYGLKMTHKVAGPLFKVGLYLGKMREGRFTKVYNLRKGDQLIDFYEHFKHAHAGVVAMQEADIARLRAVIEAAEAAGAGEDAAVGELREVLARKEKSLE